MVLSSWRSLIRRLSEIGASAEDAPEVRLQKSLMVAGIVMSSVVGAVWGAAYITLDEPAAGAIPLSYAVVSLLDLIYFSLTRRYRFFRNSQLVLILLLPFAVQFALGGFINSSAVIVWSFLCPMGAVLFAGYRAGPRWLAAYLAAMIVSGLLQPYVRQNNHLSQGMITAFFVLNIGALSALVFALLHYFVKQREQAYRLLAIEQDRSESLLLNVLPEEIAQRLKSGEQVVADQHDSVSILFADLVGFTPLTNELSPNAMVSLLNQIYSHFDLLIEEYGVEKIRTIGDNYMVAAGLPRARRDHAQALAGLALEMNAYISGLKPAAGKRLSFRIGINSGPAIAGVLGFKKFAYDVWGDTVNVASRMESQGTPGQIQITQDTYDLIKDEFICQPNGPMYVKGKGTMNTWFLIRRMPSKGKPEGQQENEAAAASFHRI